MDDPSRQRGYYSEFIAPDVSILAQSELRDKEGPLDSSIFRVNQKQKMPRALNPSKIQLTAVDVSKTSRSRLLNNSQIANQSSVNIQGGDNTSHLPGRQEKKLADSRNFFAEKHEPISTVGLYSRQEDGVADAEPKVYETYEPIRNRVPRKVEIDRKKKEYKSFRIEELLAEAGVDKDGEPSYLSWLPLELFDDETFDDYSPAEWMQKAIPDPSGRTLALLGRGCLVEGGKHVWKNVLIHDYYEPDKEFICTVKQTGERVRFKRINLWFEIEDPRKFVARIKQAHDARRIADSKVRYNYYIDNMPRADVNVMDTEQRNRLFNNANEPKRLIKSPSRKNLSSTFEENLKTEAASEYERTMNKIIFNTYFEEANPDLYKPFHIEIPEEVKPPVPYFGIIEIPKQEFTIDKENEGYEYPASKKFTDIFKEFIFSSLFIKEEVITVLQEIKLSCMEIEKRELFNTDYKDTDRIEGFRQKQGGQISLTATHLKDNWIPDLTQKIKTKFEKVGKGWFNLADANNLTYEFGKLKRFLTQVRLMMQDTLYTMIHRGLFQFRDYLQSFVPDEVIIESQFVVHNRFLREIPENFKKNPGHPLIKIDLIRVANQNEFNYSIRPQKLVEEVLTLVSKGLEEMEKIPDLEPKILEKLFKARKTVSHILTPQLPKSEPEIPDPTEKPRRYPDENKWVWDLYQEYRKIMEKAVEPLKRYTEMYEKYKPLIAINPDEYIMKLEHEEGAKTAEGLQAEISRWAEAEAKVKQEIPEEVTVSCFLIDCRELIRFLTSKYQDMNKRLIELMARKARDKIASTRKQIAEILKKVRQSPTKIEELAEFKNFCKDQLQIDLQKIRNETAMVVEIHDILESYEYRIPKEDASRKWEIFKGPLEIEEEVENRQKDLQKFNDEFLEEMGEDQETFLKTIKQQEDAINRLYESNKEEKIEDYANTMEKLMKNLETMREESMVFMERERLFGKEPSDYSKIETLRENLTPYYNLWTQIYTWKKFGHKWMEDHLDKVDALKAEAFVDNGYMTILKSLRSFNDKDPNFKDLIQVATKIKKEIEEFKPNVPLLVSLKREGMADRHWAEISKEHGKELHPNKPIPGGGKKTIFNLKYLLQEGLDKKLQLCINVGEKAYKEFEIERDLNTMENQWKETNFQLAMPIPGQGVQVPLIKNFEEIEAILDEHLTKSQNLMINPYKEQFAKRIEEWNAKLILISTTLEEWGKLQRNWKYLSPIFESPDIARQMPQESNNFKRVDANWKHTMNHTKAILNVKKACTDDPILEKFKESNKALDNIQAKLRDYLEKKRSAFGRFYFLSDDDLLSILSQAKDVDRVQEHLRKVFESIDRLDIEVNSKKILGMFSVEKEYVKYNRPIDPGHKQVEDWMSEVEREMKKTVRESLKDAILDYPDTFASVNNFDRNNWVLRHPGQCVLNGSQVRWTAEVETAINTKTLEEYANALNIQLNKLIKIERKGLSKNHLITIEALIVIDVHAQDIVAEKLVKQKIDKLDRYEWISQLRYYWMAKENEKEDNCWVNCIQTEYPYGYEYLGNSNRLVITPLTDKCYITLMGALNLNIGGAPAGPAGTGKTESTKDLAKALAKQCVVFNCQESMNYQFVGKFFKGLASSGAWCCFDEFNRINLEVLSVIAQQLQELFTAKAKNCTNINFEGSEIKLQNTFCVFITMNPGYAGRTELPDNLKALFRPVAMMVPDYAMISEIKLFSFGFSKEMGRELAKKLVATFKLSSEQLSSQYHYDYGMRAVTSVINAAGLLKRNANLSHLSEDQLILKAIRDVNVPKFLKDDLPLFKYIIKDLFPDTPEPKDNYGQLGDFIIKACADKDPSAKPGTENHPIQPTDVFLNKVYQLYDTIQVRHGLMLVGPTGGGKTTNWKILQKAMTLWAKAGAPPEIAKVNVEILNPKSITMAQLYGESKEMTWNEGIIEKIAEKAISNQHDKEKGTEKYWIMFDGPVDALWIESMNTVLDDNKKLCLSSGKVMILTSYMTMMFEVEDLAVASPATVSRCGMVYMEPVSLTVQPLIDSFLQKIPPNIIALKQDPVGRLKTLIDLFVPDCLKLLRSSCKEIMETFDNNIVSSLLKMLWIVYRNYFEVDGIKKKPAEIEKLLNTIDNYFVFCFIWSFCCTVDIQDRAIMDEYVRTKIALITNSTVTLPLDKTVYDYEYSFNENKWFDWTDKFKDHQIGAKQGFGEIVIPTLDYCRIRSLMSNMLTNKLHMLIVGQTGTGKSVDALSFLGDGLSDRFTGLSVVLSAQTSSAQLQDTIFQQLSKRKKGVYGPENGKTMICLVDDLNMPKKEQYGAQPPIELLRQYLDHKAWYVISLQKEYTQIDDVVLLGAMGPPGGGRTHITDRLVRHFNIVCLSEITHDQVTFIFKRILDHFMRQIPDEVKECLDRVIPATLDIYDRVRRDLKPIPSKTHYTFNLRDIAKVLQGVTMAAQSRIKTNVNLARLWYHENMRVFHDRLTTQDDREYIKKQLGEVSKARFDVSNEELLSDGMIIFCDFLYSRFSDSPDYVKVEWSKNSKDGGSDFSVLEERLEDIQRSHNESCKPKDRLDLVMFFDACEHVTRITRVLRQPQGSVLLLGVGGSGRQSLTRLSVFIRGQELRVINVVKGYNFARWREDLKSLISSIIETNKAVCFLFVDTQIVDEQMVEDINCLLNSGWVVGLPFTADDMEKLDDIGRRICADNRLPISKINIYTSQVNRIKKNLHISFAMSPLSEAFLTRMRMFPSFVNCCTIDWFTEWPEDALRRVGKKEMEKEMEEEIMEEKKKQEEIESKKQKQQSPEKDTGEDAGLEAENKIKEEANTEAPKEVKVDALKDSKKERLGILHILDPVVEMFKTMHKSVEELTRKFRAEVNRYNYITPKSYLELLALFKKILKNKNEKNVKSINRLKNGIQMLRDANDQVATLNIELEKKRPELAEKSKSVEADMITINESKKEAEAAKVIVEKESKAAKEQEKEALIVEEEASKAAEEGQRILDEGLKNLENLNKDSLKEMAAYQKPAPTLKILTLVSNVLLEQDASKIKSYFLKTQEDTDAHNYAIYKNKAKQLSMLDDLKEVADQFGQKEKFLKLIDYLEDPQRKAIFTYDAMKNVSIAAGNLCKFCEAMITSFKISEKNAPLRLKLEQSRALVAKKRQEVAEKKAELEKVIAKVRALEAGLEEKNAELNNLKRTIESNEQKLERAKKLTNLLRDENERWGNEISSLILEKDFIPGNCLISSGMVAYSGPFTMEYRNMIEKSWMEELTKLNILFKPELPMRKYLADPVKLMQWNVNGLPKDDTSTENGVILDFTERWPLMIDPQTQANKFLKKSLKDSGENHEIIKASSPMLQKVIEKGLTNGFVILVENVGLKLDPALEPILLKQTTFDPTTRGRTITLGDKSVSYHDKFKFLMTTTIPNPHYSPEICAKVTIVNFGITMTGLVEQMLATIVNLEDRKLEDSKMDIVKSNAEDRKELVGIEDQILNSLSESSGTILEGDKIVDQLSTSKNKSKQISQRVKDSKITEENIDKARENYRRVAIRASILFFCIVDLATIDPMYQYSLQWFENLFATSVSNTPQRPKQTLEDRLTDLNKQFTMALYRNVCRSLFGKHKLLFSFLMTTRILTGEGEADGGTFDSQAYRHLLTGPTGEVKIPVKTVDWINSDSTWRQIFTEMNGLDQLPKFRGILRHFMSNIDEWRPIYESNDPVKEPMPAEWESKLHALDRILVIKALRPDKVVNAVQDYIEKEKKMGRDYIEVPIIKLEECFDDSKASIPLIFILSQGSDPKADFDAFALSRKILEVKSISLGQGQGIKAKAMIDSCKASGGWALLQNCHLAASWMSELEAIVESLGDSQVNKEFRLWLTSMPSADFPISILQNSVKMTIEPPQGIKDNLKKSYEGMNKDELDDEEDSNKSYKKLLYGLCFFHAIIQDRRKFGPIGWNIAYEFTYEDLEVCRKQLKMFLTKAEIPYEVIRTICADINYGGRVTDKKDARLINAIILKFINSEVLKDGHDFGNEEIYISPEAKNHQFYLEVISKLPLNPSPEIFGLHANAAITYAQNQTRLLLEALLSIQPKDTGGASDARNTIIMNTTTTIESRTPEMFDLEAVKKVYPPDDYNESMNTVLIQELIRCNRLLDVMKTRLKDLKLAIKGEVVMSEELEKIANAFYIQQVPVEWSYPLGFLSLKPLNAWIEELNQRTDFFSSWIKNGQPCCFWFGGFFFPQAFITGTQQNFARKNQISIDQIKFDYELREDIRPSNCNERPETGVYVHGIFLEGARWDSRAKYLNHSLPKELFSNLPVLHLRPIVGEENLEGMYECPLYKVVSRAGTLSTTGHSTNFVMDILLKIRKDDDPLNWVRAGVAAFLSLRN
jgi:dynein heavy chain